MKIDCVLSRNYSDRSCCVLRGGAEMCKYPRNLTVLKRLNRHTIERKQTELHMNVGCGSSNT